MATPLSPGDIAIVGFRSGAPDGLAFVTFKDLEAGTMLGFTDASYQQPNTPGSWRGTENFAVWTASTAVPAGTVVVLSFPNSPTLPTADSGSVSNALNGLSNSGDQIFVYQRSDGTVATTSPFTASATQTTWNAANGGSLLFGINLASTGGFVTSGTVNLNSTNFSYVPDAGSGAGALSLGTTALNITNAGIVANAQYAGARSGLTLEQFKALVLDQNNWSAVDPATGILNSTDFSVGLPSTQTPTITEITPPPFLNLPETGAGAVSGVINDPTDPAKISGINFAIADPDTLTEDLTVTVTSSNTTVVPNANLNLTGSGSFRNLRINPTGVGETTIAVSVSDGTNIATYTINYAASAASVTPNATRFHTGTSDASTAVAIDGPLMLVGDDEDQTIRLYDRNLSGLPLAAFDFTSALGLTDVSGSGVPREVDIEGSTRIGNTVYWLGSHSNASGGNDRPNRERIFATQINGTGASTTLTYAGHYSFLEDDLIAWDNTNGHGLGAGALGLAASAAAGVLPEQSIGFNIEGLTIAPDGSTAYLAFRAPNLPTSDRHKALIVPVTNFITLSTPTGGVAASASFGAPIFLDLGGRGIRSIERNNTNQYVIVAGPAGAATGIAPNDFRLYTWTGNPADAAALRSADLTALLADGSFESIVEVPDNLTDTSTLQVLVDNGDTIWYNNNTISKELAQDNFQKFRSDIVTLGEVVAPAIPGVTIAQTAGNTAVTEGGASDTYTLVLDTQPTADVTVTIANPGTPTQLALTPTTVTFTPDNWNIPQQVTVTAVDDDVFEGLHSSSITHTASSADASYNNIAIAPLTVSITDNDVAITKIHQIQGDGLQFNPLFGGTQTVEGIVVGDFTGNNSSFLRGFYVQEETSDEDALDTTSEGIFVFTSNLTFSSSLLGQKVRVTGAVSEFQDQTQLSATSFSNIQLLSGGSLDQVTTIEVTLPFASPTALERFEGMRVTFPQTLTVTNNFPLGRFGAFELSSGDRLYQPTQIAAPGADANAVQDANNLNRILVDDARQNQNPDPVIFPTPDGLSAANTLRGGSTVNGLTGVMTYTWGGNAASPNAYRVRPTPDTLDELTFNPAANSRPIAPPNVGGNLKVASFNLLNYFNGNGLDANQDGLVDGGFPTARGASNAAEFKRQRDKTIQAVLGLNADVFGYNEMENDGYDSASAVQDLVNGLNAIAGAGTYAFVTPAAALTNGTFGGDEITVGFIYKTSTVRLAPDTTVAALTTGAFDQGPDRLHRPALAATFERLEQGVPTSEIFTAVTNHFKSKGQSGLTDTTNANFDQGDGQGFWNAARAQAAQELAAWLATNPTGTTDTDYLVMGDLNAYRLENPITTLENAGYTNLFGTDSYSFQFDGQWGSLDHALVTGSLTSQITGAAKWHINADEPVVLDYNTEFKSVNQQTSFYAPDAFRSSDHDPIVVGLNLAPSVTQINGDAGNNTLIGTNDVDLIDGKAGNDTITGGLGNDTLTGGGNRDRFVYNLGDGTDTITDFGGVGTGNNPSSAIRAEIDTLQFVGSGFTARNLLLTQNGANLELSFEGVAGAPQVILANFQLENLDNLSTSPRIGNILFNGDTAIQDSFDVFNANETRSSVIRSNTVTFLNDLNNSVSGSSSADVINGQGGNDNLRGLSGSDLLRGGTGDDTLNGGSGNDTLVGGSGADQFLFDSNKTFSSSSFGNDSLTDFNSAEGDRIVLDKTSFRALTSAAGGVLDASEFAVINSANNSDANGLAARIVYNQQTGALIYNQNSTASGLGNGAQFATLTTLPTLANTDILVRA